MSRLASVRSSPPIEPETPSVRAPLRTIPEPPEKVGAPLRKVWNYYAGILVDAGVLTDADSFALLAMCQCKIEMRACERAIKKYGLLVESTAANGSMILRTNPAVVIKASADRRFRAYCTDFGLSPHGRLRVKHAKNTSRDPLSEFTA